VTHTPTPQPKAAPPDARWSPHEAAAFYGVEGWGQGYFSVSDAGHVLAHPTREPHRRIDLYRVVQELAERGLETPLLIRFADASARRVADLHEAFSHAIDEMAYPAAYRCVYPIKTNQQRHVVDEFHEAGRAFGFGLECGSKPELLAVLGMVDDNHTPIVCNGFKDRDYAEAIVLSAAMGRDIHPVIEQAGELDLLLDAAERHGVTLSIGARVKLASRGSGKWQESGGTKSKFGLTVSELLALLETLKGRGLAESFRLLHFHIGSQIDSIAHVKSAVTEASRVYVELKKLGAGLDTLDIGGGLAVDYDGCNTRTDASMNYDLQEYANGIVYHVKDVCDRAGVACPTLLSESGRALVAYHSVLITDTLGVFTRDATMPELTEDELDQLPGAVRMVVEAYRDLEPDNCLEYFHDAQAAWQDAQNLFRLGHCSLEHRAVAERCYAAVCGRVMQHARQAAPTTAERDAIETELADTVFINLSVFQSLPDHWAIGQRFPVMPIHRLTERPTRRSVLADITCDSDGGINQFAGSEGSRNTLLLHEPPPPGERYLLGFFLVGAYQEILGDLHNLFGDTNAVHVRLAPADREDDAPIIEEIIEGDSIDEVLRYVQYDPAELRAWVRASVRAARESSRLSPQQADRMMQLYDHMLKGRTYLT